MGWVFFFKFWLLFFLRSAESTVMWFYFIITIFSHLYYLNNGFGGNLGSTWTGTIALEWNWPSSSLFSA